MFLYCSFRYLLVGGISCQQELTRSRPPAAPSSLTSCVSPWVQLSFISDLGPPLCCPCGTGLPGRLRDVPCPNDPLPKSVQPLPPPNPPEGLPVFSHFLCPPSTVPDMSLKGRLACTPGASRLHFQVTIRETFSSPPPSVHSQNYGSLSRLHRDPYI